VAVLPGLRRRADVAFPFRVDRRMLAGVLLVAGAVLGARLGLEALPANWIRDIERSEELLALSRDAADIVAG